MCSANLLGKVGVDVVCVHCTHRNMYIQRLLNAAGCLLLQNCVSPSLPTICCGHVTGAPVQHLCAGVKLTKFQGKRDWWGFYVHDEIDKCHSKCARSHCFACNHLLGANGWSQRNGNVILLIRIWFNAKRCNICHTHHTHTQLLYSNAC